MNLFRSIRTNEEKEYNIKAEIIAEDDDGLNCLYGDEISEYEESSRKAMEMENILGNALAMTERSNGSIHSLQRSGTNSAIEIGRRIASLHSREKMSISDVHLEDDDSFSYISRTSSLGSALSLPTFVKVDGEDSRILTQQSWDNTMSDCNEENDASKKSFLKTCYESLSHRKFLKNTNTLDTAEPKPKISNRSWNKLRREVYEESRAITKCDEEDFVPRRTQSIGKIAFGFRKKILGDSRDKSSCGSPLEKRNSTDPKNKNTRSRGVYAKDYDVEVSLEDRKNIWNKLPSKVRGGKDNKKSSTTTFKSRSRHGNNEKRKRWRHGQAGINNSFDTPKTDVEESSQTPAEVTMVERKSDVVLKMHEVHKGDLLFQALEVTCCNSINGETLDLITDMVPPQV